MGSTMHQACVGALRPISCRLVSLGFIVETLQLREGDDVRRCTTGNSKSDARAGTSPQASGAMTAACAKGSFHGRLTEQAGGRGDRIQDPGQRSDDENEWFQMGHVTGKMTGHALSTPDAHAKCPACTGMANS